ncbi:tRNA (adenosine(37)-N6)-dimethylallyltransferase MiaA [Actinomycetaceae bacterium TAE3-ERU4]|nr:tRNA (adenosine(37)-N6)-dimethylallyltransferase MiaA [Actinomycetaceae bacterium TAE3-ERU4]
MYTRGVIIAVVGPTACGKTNLSLEIAQKISGAEIIGADAMQLYRGMDIGTAKLPVSERRGIKHHQIDVLEIKDEASVAAYQKSARQDAAQVSAVGKIPIYVGGSGLYLRAALDKIDFPGTDEAVRQRLEKRLESVGAFSLHAELARKDSLAAQRIEPANGRRIVRALEVIEITGEPFSANLPDYTYLLPTLQIGLRWDPIQLDERIAMRTRQMFAKGLVEETRHLLDLGLREGKTASRATGYSQAIDYIEGRITEEEAIEAVALATRQLARRQIKWFRRDPRIKWIEGNEDFSSRAWQIIEEEFSYEK